MELIATIGVGMLTNAVYDIVKNVSGKFVRNYDAKKSEKRLIEKINSELYKDISCECREVLESSTFVEFLTSYRFWDIINAYLEQKIITNYASKNTKFKEYIQGKDIVTTKDIIAFLSEKIYVLYKERGTLNQPTKDSIYNALDHIFVVCETTIVSDFTPENAEMLYFIQSKIDVVGSKIIEHICFLQNNLQCIQKKLMLALPSQEDYEEIRKRYYDVLKEKHSEAHIYLFDKFPFDSFYVPPILSRNRQDVKYSSFGLHLRRYHYVSWDDIFLENNIVYVIGGAGYGKSLFEKKIINDYKNLNIFKPEEYIVIYGELKTFYPDDSDAPISVVEFLKNSIRSSTLIDVSSEFVQHYLDSGRCIILLDALDEVDKSKRVNLHEAVTSFFKKQNPNNKICITSRERGFIPEKDIEVFNIYPLDEEQIEKYVDKIIALKKFDSQDKDAFITQTKKLVEKRFLNSFLVLSLLISIYKAERELPENKLELYQKCFDYIATKREREKTEEDFDWSKILPLMKDGTFIELSRMCMPNNTSVDRNEIKDKLINVYKTRYMSEVEAENALEEFLKFCSERTELFVPSEEEKFKFFHRSFFEYFYSKYITKRVHDASNRLEELLLFDIDSEVFELTVAMLKQDNQQEYQELIDLMFEKATEELKEEKSPFQVFNVLILSMQVIDDAVYRDKFANLIVDYKNTILRHMEVLQNLYMIVDVFGDSKEYCEKICNQYQDEAILSILKNCVKFFEFVDKNEEINISELLDKELSINDLIPMRRRILFDRKDHWYGFYVRLFVQTKDCHHMLSTIDDKTIFEIHKKYRANNYKKPADIAISAVKRYRKLKGQRQKNALKIIVSYFALLDHTIYIA